MSNQRVKYSARPSSSSRQYCPPFSGNDLGIPLLLRRRNRFPPLPPLETEEKDEKIPPPPEKDFPSTWIQLPWKKKRRWTTFLVSPISISLGPRLSVSAAAGQGGTGENLFLSTASARVENDVGQTWASLHATWGCWKLQQNYKMNFFWRNSGTTRNAAKRWSYTNKKNRKKKLAACFRHERPLVVCVNVYQ